MPKKPMLPLKKQVLDLNIKQFLDKHPAADNRAFAHELYQSVCVAVGLLSNFPTGLDQKHIETIKADVNTYVDVTGFDFVKGIAREHQAFGLQRYIEILLPKIVKGDPDVFRPQVRSALQGLKFLPQVISRGNRRATPHEITGARMPELEPYRPPSKRPGYHKRYRLGKVPVQTLVEKPIHSEFEIVAKSVGLSISAMLTKLITTTVAEAKKNPKIAKAIKAQAALNNELGDSATMAAARSVLKPPTHG